jgi:hypothetical protein
VRAPRSTPTDVLLKQDEADPWPSTPGTPHAGAADGPSGSATAGGPASSGPRYPLRSRATGADGSASADQQACGHDPQQQHAAAALEVTRERLGTGKCGGVFAGRCEPVVGMGASGSSCRNAAQVLLYMILQASFFQFDSSPFRWQRCCLESHNCQ